MRITKMCAVLACLALAGCPKKEPLEAADASALADAAATADAAVADTDSAAPADSVAVAPAASALATPAQYENTVAKTVDASAIDQQLDVLQKEIAATPK